MLIVFAAAICVSAFLLFLMQPMIAKMITHENPYADIQNGTSGMHQITMNGTPQPPTVLGAEAFAFSWPTYPGRGILRRS
jgi:hypothetical protein